VNKLIFRALSLQRRGIAKEARHARSAVMTSPNAAAAAIAATAA